MIRFAATDRVSTEFGEGTVTEVSSRRIVIRLDAGDVLNIVTGTFGYERVLKIGA